MKKIILFYFCFSATICFSQENVFFAKKQESLPLDTFFVKKGGVSEFEIKVLVRKGKYVGNAKKLVTISNIDSLVIEKDRSLLAYVGSGSVSKFTFSVKKEGRQIVVIAKADSGTYITYKKNTNEVCCNAIVLDSVFVFKKKFERLREIIDRPGAGAEQWIKQNHFPIKTEDAYYRFNWLEFQSYNSAANSYTWTAFDNQINDAINNGQKFSFGIMTICGSCPNSYMVGGYGLQYPLYLHNQMQAEPVKDWGASVGGVWVPNWNSNSYLTALENLNAAINDHINNTSYKGVLYKNVIGYIDIRHYGNWGEWNHSFLVNSFKDFPPGTAATGASLIRLINAHVNNFPDFQLVIMQAAFDAARLQIVNVPLEAGYHALTVSNNVGKIGWRRDSWGWTDGYNKMWTDENYTTYKGMRFDTAIMNRYKYAPVVGEPADLGIAYFNNKNFGDLVNQVNKYHVTSFGNGNVDVSAKDTVAQNAFMSASAACGYNIVIDSVVFIKKKDSITISATWQNVGASPTYENWNVVFELRNVSNTTLWSGTSIFKPRLFLPITTSTTYTDNITLPSTIPQGSYNLYVIIKDPNNYRKPFPLAIKGRNTDGSYWIANIVLQ